MWEGDIMVKFLRRTWNRYAKLGKGRKKKQVWRRPTGRDNKMREKRKGYPAVVSVGYKKGEKVRGLLKDKKPIIVRNLKELGNVEKNEIIVIGNVGKKKKIEIAKKVMQMKIEIYNLNVKSFLKKIEFEQKKKRERKEAKKKVMENKKSKKEKKKLEKEGKTKEKMEEKK
jgi:large subunit ribosomal protein L32e